MGTCLTSVDILSRRDIETFPGRIGDASDIAGGILELNPKTQTPPPRPPQGPFDSYSTGTRWSALLKIMLKKRNPRTGEVEERPCRLTAKIRCRWIASRDGKSWERFVMYR
jgi:hypothetical protein